MRPMTVDQVIHDELENWARVVRDPRFVARTCYSAEGRYRPVAAKDDRERAMTAMPAPDVHAGLLAERVICSPLFPRLARAMLIGHYVLRADRRQVCRRCAVPLTDFDCEIGRAARIFANRLDSLRKA